MITLSFSVFPFSFFDPERIIKPTVHPGMNCKCSPEVPSFLDPYYYGSIIAENRYAHKRNFPDWHGPITIVLEKL